jgi:hypothetical protein
MTPTIRDHVAALAGDVDYLIGCVQDGESDPVALQQCADDMYDARAALAAEPVGEGPSDADFYDLAEVFNGDPVPAMRQALELWGRPAAPPAPEVGEVAELVQRLGWIAAQLGDIGWGDDSASVATAATLLQQLSAPAPPAPEVGEVEA